MTGGNIISILQYFKKRPFCFACLIFLAASFLIYNANIYVKLILLGICIPLLFFRKVRFLSIAAMFAVVISLLYFNLYYKSFEDKIGETSVIEGYALKNTSYTNYSSGYDIKITKIDDKKVNVKSKLYTEYPCDLDDYESFRMTVTFIEMEDNVFGFPEKNYNISNGFLLKTISTNEHKNYDYFGTIKKPPSSIFTECNKYFSNILYKHLERDNYKFVDALLLGNKYELPASMKRDFRTLGLSHIIAVSGMHFSILFGMFGTLLGLLKIDKIVINIILIVFAIFFMGLTGFSPSVTRSAIMFIIYSLSFLFGRTNDSVTSLFLSVTLVCIINPNAVFDVGLLLSFSATLGIITLGSILKPKTKIKPLKFILESFIMTICAILFTLPFMWIFFGELSIISPLTNIIVNLPATFILYLAPFIIILNKIPPLLFFAKVLINLFCNIFFAIVEFFTQFSGSTVSLGYDFVKYVFIVLIAGFLVLSFMKIKNPIVYFIPVVASILVFSVCLFIYNMTESKIVRINYITYKNNDGFIVVNGNRGMICDISDGSYGITNIANNLLSDNYYMLEIDTYMFTHYHQRHISTFYRISQYTYVRNVILPEPVNEVDKNVFNNITALAELNGCNVIIFSKDEDVSIVLFDNIQIDLMKYTKLKRSTHPVLSLSFKVNDLNYLYIGSSAHETLNFFGADVVVYGRHGPILKSLIDIGDKYNFLQYIIYGNQEIFDMVKYKFDVHYKIHNDNHYNTEIIFNLKNKR